MAVKVDQIIQIYSDVLENYFDRSSVAYRRSLAGRYQPNQYFQDLATTSKQVTDAWKASWDAAYPDPRLVEIEVKVGQASVLEVHVVDFDGTLPLTHGPFTRTGNPNIPFNVSLTTDATRLIVEVSNLATAVVTGTKPYKATVAAGASWEQKLRLHVLP